MVGGMAGSWAGERCGAGRRAVGGMAGSWAAERCGAGRVVVNGAGPRAHMSAYGFLQTPSIPNLRVARMKNSHVMPMRLRAGP
jgi:hypothetical protein